MWSEYKIVLSHFVALTTAVLAVLAATLTAYFQDQLTASIRWIMRPLAARLPWNRTQHRRSCGQPGHELVSLFTVAQLRIFKHDGSQASYEKTSDYKVEDTALSRYREAVTAEGSATNFATLIGRITETVKEHGFYASLIDLGNVLYKGARFQNTYSARLENSFGGSEEHWTQEIAVLTEHLTIRVIFPKSRPPTLLRCKLVHGLDEIQLPTSALFQELSGCPSAIWDISHPHLGSIYKLEWRW